MKPTSGPLIRLHGMSTVACDTCDPGADEANGKAADSAIVTIPLHEEDVLNPATFNPPTSDTAPSISIEFCDRCRWLHRATWTQTELFLTFPAPLLKSITLIPLNSAETAGRFRVWFIPNDGGEARLLWDRKTRGGFPELKDLKQLIRDIVQPGLSLGHSDKKST